MKLRKLSFVLRTIIKPSEDTNRRSCLSQYTSRQCPEMPVNEPEKNNG